MTLRHVAGAMAALACLACSGAAPSPASAAKRHVKHRVKHGHHRRRHRKRHHKRHAAPQQPPSVAPSAVPGTTPFTPPAGLVWSGDAEQPWDSQWANFSCADPTRVARVTSPVAQGTYAYRLHVNDGDNSFGERCELGQGNPTRTGFPLFNEGDDRWIAFQVYLPDDFPLAQSRWDEIAQWKQLGDLCAPPFDLHAEDNKFILMRSDDNHLSCGGVTLWEGAAQKNRWARFLLHVRFSPRADTGFIELYGDPDGAGLRELMPRTRTFTMKVDDLLQAVPVQARIGIYRDPAIAGDATVYFDGYTVASTRQAAEAAAFGP